MASAQRAVLHMIDHLVRERGFSREQHFAPGTILRVQVDTTQPIVTDNNGLFTVTLGTQISNPIPTKFFNGAPLWISVYIEDVELLPRVRVAHARSCPGRTSLDDGG